jgi:hypothetical protein
MSALADYRMLWRAAVNQRQPGLVTRSYFIIPACMLVVAALSAALTRDWATTLYHTMNMLLIALAVYFATIFVPGAALLNTPANARLVPRARRRLMQMTALGWIAIALVLALELGSTLNHMFLLFAAIGIAVVGLGLAQGGYPAGGLMPIVLPTAVSHFRPQLEALDSPVLTAAATLALLGFGAFALQLIFPSGGDRHWSLRRKVLRAAERATGEGQFTAAPGWRLGSSVYAALLKRDCERRAPAALLLHVLGPTAHWSQVLLPPVAIVGLAAAAKFLIGAYTEVDSLSPAGLVGLTTLIVIVMLLQVYNLERVAARLSATRGEQALLRMAPLTAPARQFNRQLGGALLRYALLNWAAVSLVATSLTVLSGASVPIIVMQASLCCLGLPLMAAVLRDHARHAGIMGWRLVPATLAIVLASAVGSLLAVPAGLPGWPALALTSAVIAMLAVSICWRAMLAAPVAFPVGRLA